MESKFGEKTISRKMDCPWPTRSSDSLPPDFFLLGACNQYIRDNKPTTIEQLMIDVNESGVK